jgi:hypothetical protein
MTEGKGGELMINNGVTRATRIHYLAPGQLVRVEVTEVRRKPISRNCCEFVMFRRPNKEGSFMRDPERIPLVLQEIERLWRLHPDWRLGQLVCNLAAWADPTQNIVWDVEDDVLVAEAQHHLEQYAALAAPNDSVAGKS